MDNAPRPLLFLDVDGVLNCPTRHELHRLPAGMRVWLPAGTADRVHRLLDVFDPVWATCWREDAHPAFAPLLGIDGEAWPHIEFAPGAEKLPEILRFALGPLGHDRAWAWIDDDIAWELDRLKLTPDYVDGLLVQPDPAEGLTDEHVERLLAWAREVGS